MLYKIVIKINKK